MYRDLSAQVLWLFAEAQKLAKPHCALVQSEGYKSALYQDLNSIKGAYRERQKAAGLCVACPRERSPMSVRYCEEHREAARVRMKNNRDAAKASPNEGGESDGA